LGERGLAPALILDCCELWWGVFIFDKRMGPPLFFDPVFDDYKTSAIAAHMIIIHLLQKYCTGTKCCTGIQISLAPKKKELKKRR
jgi:hypothetical protein